MKIKYELSNVNALQAFHVLRQGAVMLVSIVLAKSSLSTESIGHWELLLYIGYTLSFFWVSGLVQGMLTIFPKLEAQDRKVFTFNVYLLFCAVSLAILLLLTFSREPVIFLLTNHHELPHLGIFSLYLALSLPVFLLENLYLLHDKPKSIFTFGIFSAAGHVLSIGIPVWVGEGLGLGIAGLAIFALIRHLLLLQFIWKNSTFSYKSIFWKQLLQLSLPLMIYSVVGGVQVALAAWFVAFFFPGDQTKFAIFRYGAQELPFALALTNGFGTAMLPQVAADLTQALQNIRTKSLRLFHWLFPIAVVIMLSSHLLFPLVFRAAFAESVPVFNIFLLILITRMVFPRTILVGLESNAAVLWISVAEIIAFAVLGFVLGRLQGLAGIALATLLAYAIEKILLCGFLFRRFGIGVGEYTDLRWFAFYSLLLTGAYAVASFLPFL